jgi:uncharacterized protein YxeA
MSYLNLLANYIKLLNNSLSKYSKNKGEYKNFKKDLDKISSCKKDLLEANLSNFSAEKFDLKRDNILKNINKEFYNSIYDKIDEIKSELKEKHIQQQSFNNTESKLKKTETKETEIKNIQKNKQTNIINSLSSKISTKTNNTKSNITIIVTAIILLIIVSFFTAERTSYDKNNRWVKECLAIGFTENSEVAACAERQKQANYEYQKILAENKIMSDQIRQSNEYQQQVLREKQYQNDMVKNKILLDLSRDLMGLNNNNSSPAINCLVNPMGWTCR